VFDTILIAVDGSDCSRRAAAVGLGLATRYDAAVEIVHVAEADATQTDDPTTGGRELLESATALPGGERSAVETRLVDGRPHEAILKRAATADADLVVVGRRGRHGVAKRLLGSVTELVLRRSDVPVLTVPADEDGEDTGAAAGDVLVTTDGSEAAERAAPYAADLAETADATLHVLHAVDVQARGGLFDAGGVSREFVDRLEEQGRDAVDRLEEQVDHGAVRSDVRRGPVPEVVNGYVDEHGVGVVVVSSAGQSSLVGQRIGSTAGDVLRSSPVPVLVVTTG
jgi:nucleotide-binding universal stress UspA family protein